MAATPNTAKKTASASATKNTASAKAAVKKPAAAKTAAPIKAVTAVAKKPAATKKPAAKNSSGAKLIVTPEQRYCMVAEAAYFHAERHGFLGDPVQDWIAAEAQIAALLSKK